ncbi:MAG: hypothetical protein WBI10_04725, partial [Syntrophales bacterium]
MGITNLEQFCRQFRALLAEKPEMTSLIRDGGGMMSELMGRRDWFGGILEKILFDREFSEGQRVGIWPNEITLHRSPDRSFQV